MVQATRPNQFADHEPVDADRTGRPLRGPTPLRIYYVPLAQVGTPEAWPTILDGCAGMGFDTVLVSLPTAPPAVERRHSCTPAEKTRAEGSSLSCSIR